MERFTIEEDIGRFIDWYGLNARARFLRGSKYSIPAILPHVVR